MNLKYTITLIFICLSYSLSAQSLDEIFLHFSDDDIEVPLAIREQMVQSKGNTLNDFKGYRLRIYDKRARFLQVVTPTERTYEIAVWKQRGKGLLVGLLKTVGDAAKVSTLRFFLPDKQWQELPSDSLLPEMTLADIFSEKKMEKHYHTLQSLVPDLPIKLQFFLPQSGSDIIVTFTCLDELDKKEFNRIYKYLEGTMLDLIWKDGTFIKGPAYFLVN